MRRVMRASILSILILTSSVAVAESASIRGTVVDEQGKAVSDALVDVYTAKPRVGTIPYCPSCYADCRKEVTTDAAGRFAISSLNPKLLFTLLVVADGSFHFFNLPPNLDYYVYAKMESLQERGALTDHEFQTGDHGSRQGLGELSLEPAHHLAGRVVLADGGHIPEGTHLLFLRDDAWDSQIIEVDRDGRFAVQGLPPEVLTVHLHIRGYRLSESNPSLDPMSGRNLIGQVAGDMDDFVIELERGDLPRINLDRQSWQQQRRMRDRPLQCVPAASTMADGITGN